MTSPAILSAPHISQKYKPNPKKKAGEAQRIEMLGKLNDRYKDAKGARNKAALIELAADYALIGCPDRASQIMSEAEGL
jgi:hypothetical protein